MRKHARRVDANPLECGMIALPTEADPVKVICGDALEVLRTLPGGSVDLVLTDPPYNVGKAYDGYGDSLPPGAYLDWLAEVLTECGRVSRDGVVFFPGVLNLFDAPALVARAGLRPVRLLGWHRREYAGDLWRGGPAICWEPVVWASKCDAPFYNRIFGAWGRDFLVIDCVRMDPMREKHPCPKPPDVMRWLAGLFCPRGGTLLDVFAGTGTAGVAALRVGCRALLVEQSTAYCDIIRHRVGKAVHEDLFSTARKDEQPSLFGDAE